MESCVKKLFLLVLFTLSGLLAMNSRDNLSTSAATLANIDQPKPELLLQTGHSKQIEAIIFSPVNGWAASGSFDNSIKIWEVETGRELRSLIGHSGAVRALAVSPDGKRLASGSNDGTARIWDVETARVISNFDNNKNTVEATAFSPDGKRLAYGGSDNKITIRDLESAREPTTLTGHKGSITAVVFSPDGHILASGSADHTVKTWDVGKGKLLREIKPHTDEIRVVRFSDDGLILASGGLDKAVHLAQTLSGKEIAVLPGHTSRVLAIKFTAADRLISADAGGTIETWETLPKRPPLSSVGGSEDKERADSVESAAFSTDGALLAIGNGDGTSTITNTKSGQVATTLENYTTGFYGAVFSENRNWLAAAGSDNTVKLWELKTGQALPPLKGHSGKVNCVAFHPDNRHIISGSLDKTIRIWDTVSQRSVGLLNGHEGSIESIAVGNSGNIVVSGSADKSVAVWSIDETMGTDEKTIQPRFLKKEHTDGVVSVAISNDEKFFVSGSRDGTIKVWDVADGHVIRTLDPKLGEIDAVAISPDDKLIAFGGTDKSVNIWDLKTAKKVQQMPGHTRDIQSVSFNPKNRQQLVSTSRDKSLRLWDVSAGTEIRPLNGHAGTVYSASYSSDGRLLVSASEDGSLMIWNAAGCENLATLVSSKKNDDWLVVTPGGFFDGSQSAWEQLSWRFENNTFNVKPVEIFLKEFWQPGLLAQVVNSGKPLPNLTILNKDRRQPVLKLTRVDDPSAANNIKVRITVSQTPATVSQAAVGAKDVRLFRNGSLVKVWRGDVMDGKNETVLDWSLPIVAGENRLTAYAFNSDDIKSHDQTLIVTGAPALEKKGVMYVFAIGVNEYASPDRGLRLNVAVNDAKDFAEEFKRQQVKLKNYDRVEVIPLIDADATKANIRQTLVNLSASIHPEDALIIFFAGHGVADANRFYIIPYDYKGVRTYPEDPALKGMLQSALSDEELETSVETIDVGQFLVVIDACESGQAIETQENWQPLNNRGLAQLALDKGMYILAASQASQSAKEDKDLGHGYLTYALVEGLKTANADQDHDGRVVLREWLDYAAKRVPQIDSAERERKLKKEAKKERPQGREITWVRPKGTGQDDPEALQRTRVAYPREAGTHPLIVAQP